VLSFRQKTATFCLFFINFIIFFQNMATNTQSLAEKYKNILSKSKTAYNPGVAPTSADVAAQQGLLKTQAVEDTAESEQIKRDWYGEPADAQETTTKKSYLQGVLHTLGAPLYGIVGGVEAALGKGTKKGLANIRANVAEQGTFGDLLRSYGISNLVSAPLGFALDVAADPLNWVTAGTAALIPRIGLGAIKGGVKGAKLGLESGLLMKGEKLGKFIPGVSKKAFVPGGLTGDALTSATAQASEKLPTFYRNLSSKATEARGAYEDITKTGLTKALEDSVTKVRVLDRFDEWLNARPWGQKVSQMFGYKPGEAFAATGAEDVATNLAKDTEDTVAWAKNPSSKMPKNSLENDAMMAIEANADDLQKQAIKKEMERMAKEIEGLKTGLLAGDETSLAKLNALSPEEQKTFLSNFEYYRSGMFEKTLAKSLLIPAARKFLNNYAVFIGMFKNAKVGFPLSLSSGVNSIVGNPTMAAQWGMNISNPDFHKSMLDAIKIVWRGDYAPLIRNKSILDYAKVFTSQFTHGTGIYPTEMFNGRFINDTLIPSIVAEGKRLGKYNTAEFDKAGVELTRAVKEVLTSAANKTEKGAGAIGSVVANQLNRGAGSSFFASEILQGPMGETLKKWKKLGDAGSFVYDALYKAYTVPLNLYSRFDQTYKVATLLHFVEHGVSYDELIRFAKRLPISPRDVTQVTGRNLWKMTPQKALEISNEMYMDYSAMPGFVKMMRTLPIGGSPFFSFTAGAMAQTAKAAMYNPSVFNKVNYLIKEISGEKSPLEKQALASPYYKWYDRPGMLKIPFFEKNPVYLNMSNMLTYYTMNAFQPSERDYKSKYGDAVAAVMDKLPFFKDPVGQVWFDYMVQPMILQGEQAKGAFNQPLWSKDAGLAEKVGRGTQTLAESVLPPMLGMAGLVAPWGETGEKIIPYLPSYRWKQLAYATRGKSSIGAETKENALEKTARVMSAMAGLPVYQIKLQYNTPK